MQRTVRFGVALVAVAMISSCSPDDQAPTPPEPPDLTGQTASKLPGSDDFAHARFAYPLPLTDAEAVLRRTRVFAFGGMPPKRQVQAFNIVFEQADAASRFQSIGAAESPAGRLYAFAGLLGPSRLKRIALGGWLRERSGAGGWFPQ